MLLRWLKALENNSIILSQKRSGKSISTLCLESLFSCQVSLSVKQHRRCDIENSATLSGCPILAHVSELPDFNSRPQAILLWVSVMCSCVTAPRVSPRPCAPTKVCCWWTPPSGMPTSRSSQPGFEPTTWRRSRLSSATTSTTSSAWRTGEVSLCLSRLWNQRDVVMCCFFNLYCSAITP